MAKMNFTCSGGSSRVLRSALNASFVSMCTSSIMYILNLSLAGANLTFERSSLISSIPRFDAPSISRTSIDAPSDISLHDAHLLHGFGPGPLWQFNAFARIRAVVVLPVPRGPVKR